MEKDLTILMPTYNGSDTIQLTLRRILIQGVNARVIVMDNGSTDGTLEMLKEAKKNKHYGELDIELYKCSRIPGEPKHNKCNIREKLIKLASTQYVFWLDDDILLSPFTLQNILVDIRLNPQCGLMGVQYQPWNQHIGMGCTIMPLDVAKKIKWELGKDQQGNEMPCECGNIMEQVKKMGYEPRLFNKAMAQDLSKL